MTGMPEKLFLVLLVYDVVDAVEHIGHHLHNAVHRRKRIEETLIMRQVPSLMTKKPTGST